MAVTDIDFNKEKTEIFTQAWEAQNKGYRTMGLGKVVSEPTGGWIIFTSSVTLVGGSSVRLPFSKIEDHEGKDMELHPRPVDILVSRALGEGNAKDFQLDVAAKELLLEVGNKKSR